MENVTPSYEQQLTELAESLVTPDRFSGQLVLAEVVELLPVIEDIVA